VSVLAARCVAAEEEWVAVVGNERPRTLT